MRVESPHQEPVLFHGEVQINIEGKRCRSRCLGAEADLCIDVVEPCLLHLQLPFVVGYQAVHWGVARLVPL